MIKHGEYAGLVPTFSHKVEALRNILALDPKLYAQRKRELPYFTTSVFKPLVRHKENFISAAFMVLDIDHCERLGYSAQELRDKLFKADERVLLAFVSPGGNGLKLLFGFNKAIFDSSAYTAVYKSFAMQFAHEHQLGEAMDMVTHDVSRVCFLSFDPEVRFRDIEAGEGQLLNTEGFCSQDIVPLFGQEHQQVVRMAGPSGSDLVKANEEEKAIAVKTEAVISKAQISAIIEKLNPKAPVAQKSAHVPLNLTEVMPEVIDEFEKLGLAIVEERPVQYGVKVAVNYGRLFGELNIYYGKRGFSVVTSPKQGTDSALNEQLKLLAEAVIYRTDRVVERHYAGQ